MENKTHHGSKLLLLLTTVLAFTTTRAVDIQGFDSSTACSGTGYTFPGIGAQVCTAFNVGSVLIRDLPSCSSGKAYRGGGCTTAVLSGNGPTVWCFTGGSFTGAAWFNGCRRRRLMGATEDQRCTNTAAPNGVHYTENPSTGSWVLHTANATDMLAALRGVDDAQKAKWLEAHGAYHVPGSDKITMV